MESSDEESYHYFAENDSSSDDDVQIIQENLVMAPATTSIKLDKSTYDEEEIQILKEILVKTPAMVTNMKKEKSFYQPNLKFTWVNGNLEKQSLLQPAKKILENEPIRASKDALIGPSVEKQHSVTFESRPSKAPFVMTTPPDQQEGAEKYGQLERPALKVPRAVKRLQDWNIAGDKEKEIPIRPRRRKPFARSGLTVTPDARNVYAGVRSGETTGDIHDEVARSRYQGNEPVEKRNSDITRRNEPIKKRNGDITGGIEDTAIGQLSRSQGNLTIKVGRADMAVTNGGLTVRMKISDVSISGQADEVSNFVSKLSKTLIENE